MDGLKRSLEEAIKEMQELPVVDGPRVSGEEQHSPVQIIDADMERQSPPDPEPEFMPNAQQKQPAGLLLVDVPEPEPEPEPATPSMPVAAQDAARAPEISSPEKPVTLPTPSKMRVEEQSLVVDPAPDLDLGEEFIPDKTSIEQALSFAPSVSPHYVPPPPPPPASSPEPTTTLPPIEVPSFELPAPHLPGDEGEQSVAAPAGPEPVPVPVPVRKTGPEQASVSTATPILKKGTQEPKVQQISSPAEPLKEVRPKPARSARKNVAVFPAVPASALDGRMPSSEENRNKGGLDGDTDLAKDAAPEGGKRRDNVWRWTTIALSCVGGLASGWLGSNLSSQFGRPFQGYTRDILVKAGAGGENNPPVKLRVRQDGKSAPASGRSIGKTDRAMPMDENLCTVLELDRGTGLTLAKPCKEIENAEFNSTLGKSDLLAKPK